MNTLIARAKEFAFAAHNAIDHRRKYTDEPYTNHLERVAKLVAGVVDDPAMIAAAYLHDTVEDTKVTIKDIEREFGGDVATLVAGLTDVSRPEDGNRAFRKKLDREHTAACDKRVHTIKLADLIDNAGSIPDSSGFADVYMNEKRQLLTVLQDGNATLLDRAQEIVDRWYRNGREAR